MSNGTGTIKSFIALLIMLLAGCMNGPGFLKQSGDSNQKDKDVEVDAKAAEDIEGAVIGEFKATSQSTQVLSAGEDSAVQGATISIAPNSLAIDTNITIQEGAAIASDAVVQQVAGNSSLGVASSTSAVHVSSDQSVDLAQPMTVQLAIPDSASLTTNDLSTMVVFYKVFKKSESTWVHGFLAREKLSVANSKVSFSIQHFGAFQIVFLTAAPSESVKEVATSSSAISKKEEKSLPQVTWAASSASFNAGTRSVTVAIQATGHQEIEFCEIFADSDLAPPYDIRQNTGNSLSTTIQIKSTQATSLAFRWSCAEKNGRLSESGWSDKLSIPEMPKDEPKPVNQLPTITVTTPAVPDQPARQNGNYNIAFTASDADDVAKIALYHKNNSQGCAAGLSGWSKVIDDLKEGTHTNNNWSLSGLAPGSYFICAHINDGRGGEAYSVSSGSVKIMSAPTVQLTSGHSNPTNATSIAFTASFSHDVSGFDIDDVVVVNGTKGGFAVLDAKTYTINVTPTGGAINISVPAGGANDIAGNGNMPSPAFSIVFDGSAPTVGITSAQSSPTNSATINMTVQFSEPVTGFDLSDISVSNGTKGAFVAVDGDTFTFNITAPSGIVTVDVSAGAASDAAGNSSLVASPFSITYDGSAPTVSLSSAQSSPTNSSTINMTVQFSEVVNGFSLADIVVANGTKGNFAAVDGDTYTFDITSPSGTVTVDVPANGAKDAALNFNMAAPQFSITYDGGAPTVGLSAAQTSPTNATTINMTAQFSEVVTGFDLTDITVSNGTKGSFVAVDGDTYTFNITSPSGTVTVDIGAGAAQDGGANNSLAATQFSIVYDAAVPTVTLSAVQTSPTNATTMNITAQFSEAVTGFDLSDVAVGNGTKGNFVAVDGDTYTFDITSPSGTVTVDISGSVVTDLAGNYNLAASQLPITYDNTAPTVGLSAVQTSPTSAPTINMTVQFSEPVFGFDIDDITVVGGTKASFVAADGDTFMFDITSPSGTVTVDIAGAVSQDLAGNNNTAATQFSIVHDTAAPGVTISSAQSSPTNAATLNMTVQFSEPVSGFALADIGVTGGSKGNFSVVDGDTYTFDITAPSGTVTVDVSGAVALDQAGNSNTAATQFAIIIDNTSPGVILSAAQSSPTSSPTINMTAEFDEVVTGFDLGDISVAGGSAGNFVAVDGDTYTFDITSPSATVTVNISAGVAQDTASNPNSAASQFTIVYDNIVPTVTLSAAQGSPTDSTVINMTVVFSEPVSGFDISDVTVTGGTAGSFSGSGTTYTFNVSSLTSDVTVDVAGGVAQDDASNGNAAATQFSIVTTATLTHAALLEYEVGIGITNVPFAKVGSTVSACTPETALPSGLVISVGGGTCELSGTSSQIAAKKTYSVTVQAASGAESVFSFDMVGRTVAELPVNSPKRVTFYDSTTARHWAFYRTSSNIQIQNSSDGVHWNNVGVISPATDEFSVAAKDGSAAIAIKNGPDIELTRVTLSSASITYINTTAIVLDGSGPTDGWTQPAVAIGDDDLIYLAAYQAIGDGTHLVPKLVVSDAVVSNSVVNFGTPVKFGVPLASPKGIALVPYDDGTHKVLAAVKGHQDQVRTFLLNSTFATEKKGDGNEWWGFNGLAGGAVRAVAVMGSDIYVGGIFSTAGGDANRAGIARWDGAAWQTVGGPAVGSVLALAVVGNYLYAGGTFSSIGGTPANYIAKWNGSSWSAINAGGNGVNGPIYAMTVSGSNLYVGGGFTTVGATPANRVAKWNGSSWYAMGGGIGDGYVFALATNGVDLYAGGNFTYASGPVANTNMIARWTGSNWVAVGSGIASGLDVNALVYKDSDLFVGGNFSDVNGIADADNIARWDGSDWYAVGSGISGAVKALAVQGPDLYAGGTFAMAGGTSASNVARWNGASWSALQDGADSIVWDLTFAGPDLLVGGQFGNAGGMPATNLGRYSLGFVAKAKSFSVASHPPGATLAFVKAQDFKPYYRIFSGSTWGTAQNLSGEPHEFSQIQVAASSDGSWLLFAWQSPSNEIKYDKYNGTWSGITTLSTPGSSYFPWLPSEISGSTSKVPVLWHKTGAPNRLEIGIVDF